MQPARPTPPFERDPGERGARIQDFWKRPLQRDAWRAELLRALAWLRKGTSRSIPVRITHRGVVQVSQRLLQQLTQRYPNAAPLHYWLGYTALLLRQEEVVRRAWERVWTLAPDHWATPNIAFELGIIYAKQERFARSVAVYQKGMPAEPHLSGRGVMASNCAESLMGSGDLPGAVKLYQASLQLRPEANAAAWWGLTVAWDRMGRPAAARRAVRQALLLDPGLAGLQGRGVFFVPRGDVHYYLGLALEAQGRYREAQQAWDRFLAAQPFSRWANRARAHRNRLTRLRAGFRPVATLVRVLPQSAQTAVWQALQAPVQACFTQRAGKPPVPEGELPMVLQLERQRIKGIRWLPWRPTMLVDPPLLACLRVALTKRPLPGVGRASIFVSFMLEMLP